MSSPRNSLSAGNNDVTQHEKRVEGDNLETDVQRANQRYNEERAKRLKYEGNDQFIDISLSKTFQHLEEDPWVDHSSVKDVQKMFPDNSCEFLVMGAGLGGLVYAIRMIEAGMRPENIRIIDPAGGFGGTWYYNRFPGLACDIESYLYLPRLEETGYIPKHRYSNGEEIRAYANILAEKWNLVDSAVFCTKATKLVWDEESKEWQVDLLQSKKGKQPHTINIRSRFVAVVAGVLHWPKLPGIEGISNYQGDIFHSSRWNYSITGGSQEEPNLTELKNKRVAIIGTGASSVQIVPHLAKWSKHLYVVQRTPAAVDTRDQRKTDPDWFRKEVANSPGWQRERLRNFHQHFTTGKQPEVNLVNDQWTHANGLVAFAGNPAGPKSMDELPEYLKMLHAIDLPRQNRIRERVDRTVVDTTTAEALKPWYPSWCKRPCFGDEYLPTFNRDNVTLVDTDGKGVDRLTGDSVVVGDQSYPVDIIIFATGYLAPPSGTPAEKGNLTITGRNEMSMSEDWAHDGPKTLHGVLDHRFPNLFLSGPGQASVAGNFLFSVDTLAKHSAYILAEAKHRAGRKPFAVVPTTAAIDDWGTKLMMRSLPMAAMMGCTPGYMNLEGSLDKAAPEEQLKMARGGLWGHGIEDFLKHVEAWRAEGKMEGIDIS